MFYFFKKSHKQKPAQLINLNQSTHFCTLDSDSQKLVEKFRINLREKKSELQRDANPYLSAPIWLNHKLNAITELFNNIEKFQEGEITAQQIQAQLNNNITLDKYKNAFRALGSSEVKLFFDLAKSLFNSIVKFGNIDDVSQKNKKYIHNTLTKAHEASCRRMSSDPDPIIYIPF